MGKILATKLALILLLIGASSVLAAQPNSLEWKVEGQSLKVKDGSTWTWLYNDLQSNFGGNGPTFTGVWRQLDGWDNLGQCFVGNESGTQWLRQNSRAMQTATFADGSTLTMTLIRDESPSCEIDVVGSELNKGIWNVIWNIESGTKRFSGVTGKLVGTGTYQFLFRDTDIRHASYVGVYKLEIN